MTKPALVKDGLLTIIVVVVFFCFFVLAYAFHDEPEDSIVDSAPLVQTVALQASVSASSKTTPTLPSGIAVATTTNAVPETKDNPSATATKTEAVAVSKPNKPTIEKVTPKETVKTNTHSPSPSLSNITERSQYTQELRAHIEAATNAFRKTYKVQTLADESTLQKNAQVYSKTMLAGDFLSHTDTKGCDIDCRIKKDGYNASAWGENLAVLKFTDMPDAAEVAEFFMRGWEKSAGHRDNLLSPLFTHQGIGIAIGENAIYVTVQFADPM
jgi:uncharacterized protein YkwD